MVTNRFLANYCNATYIALVEHLYNPLNTLFWVFFSVCTTHVRTEQYYLTQKWCCCKVVCISYYESCSLQEQKVRNFSSLAATNGIRVAWRDVTFKSSSLKLASETRGDWWVGRNILGVCLAHAEELFTIFKIDCTAYPSLWIAMTMKRWLKRFCRKTIVCADKRTTYKKQKGTEN